MTKILIRATMFVSRAVNKYRDEYPTLYNDFQEARSKNREDKRKNRHRMGMKNSWITVSEDGYKEYLQMVEKYLAVKKFPNNNRKVVITTHNGGKFVGFYDNGKWWYNTFESVIEVDAHVITWEKNFF